MKKEHQMITDLRYYFDNTPREEVLRVWKESKKNAPKGGPTINEFLKANRPKQNKSIFKKVSTFLWGEKSFRWGELKGL